MKGLSVLLFGQIVLALCLVVVMVFSRITLHVDLPTGPGHTVERPFSFSLFVLEAFPPYLQQLFARSCAKSIVPKHVPIWVVGHRTSILDGFFTPERIVDPLKWFPGRQSLGTIRSRFDLDIFIRFFNFFWVSTPRLLLRPVLPFQQLFCV